MANNVLKILAMGKTTKIILLVIIVLLVLGFIFNPFYWLMQPSHALQQPKLSPREDAYFRTLEQKYNAKIKRFYYNFTKNGSDTLSKDDYDKLPFEYSLSIDLPDQKTIDRRSILDMAQHIRTSILNQNSNLKTIVIFTNYEEHRYLNNPSKGALVEKMD
jgi:hypothetical protein